MRNWKRVALAPLLVGLGILFMGAFATTIVGPRFNFYDSLLVNVDGLTISMVDTTIQANASGKKIIVGDLRDPAVMWNLSAFRAMERNGSLTRVDNLAPFPTRYAITISTGNDSIIVWDRDDWTQWISITKAGNGHISSSISLLTDIFFLDGILYTTSTVANPNAGWIDFARDDMASVNTSGIRFHVGGIKDRNTASGFEATYLDTDNMKVLTGCCYAVSAIRDPFGLKMGDGSGRPAQWWAVAGGAENSFYNPHVNAIYDSNFMAGSEDGLGMVLTSRGGAYMPFSDSGDRDRLVYSKTIFSTVADGMGTDERWDSEAGGSEDLNWATSVVFSEVAVIEGVSASGTNESSVFLGSDVGLYVLHAKANDNVSGIKQEFTSTYITPPMKGDIRAIFTGYAVAQPCATGCGGRSWTNNNGVEFPDDVPHLYTSPGGPYGDFVASNSEWLSMADHADFTFTTSFSEGLWFYRDLDSGATEGLLEKQSQAGGQASFVLRLGSTDYVEFVTHTSSAVSSVGPNAATGRWYFLVGTYDGANQRMYLNGELVDTDAQTGNINDSTEIISIGARTNAGTPQDFFDGRIWGAFLTAEVMTPEEIRAEWDRGSANILSPERGTLQDTDVDFVTAIPGWVATGNEDSVQVWSVVGGSLVESARYKSPNGNLQDVALHFEPGADSVSVFMVTTTRLQAIQPDPLVASMGAYVWPYVQPVVGETVVVDSSGKQGLFWEIDDATDAAANAGRNIVELMVGTFPPFTADQIGMTYTGHGYDSFVTNGPPFEHLTGSAPITVTVGYVVLENFSVESPAGGAGGGNHAINITGGSNGTIRGMIVRDGDNAAISIANGAVYWNIHDNLVYGADDICISTVGADTHIHDNDIQSCANFGVQCHTTGDRMIMTGNTVTGSAGYQVTSSCIDVLINGNLIDAAGTFSGTGTNTDNEVF